MSETTTKTKSTRTSSATSKATKTEPKKEASTTEKEKVAVEEKKTFVVKDLDPHMYVTVKNGFQGTLIYKSSKTGERFVWESFGDEQEMELMELRNARNSSKKFFENNWFMFDESWVTDYLGVNQFYKNALSLENFDEIFTKSPKEIEEQIALLSAGQKRSVAYRARQLVSENKIDSNKAISALEKALEIELVER